MRLFVLLLLIGCAEREGDPPPQPEPPLDEGSQILFEQWMRCMKFEDFAASGMPDAWRSLRTQDGDSCASCHEFSESGFVTSPYDYWFFHELTMVPVASKFMRPRPGEQPVTIDVVVNETKLIGAGFEREHPRFDPRAAFDPTRNFIQRTTVRYDANPLCN